MKFIGSILGLISLFCSSFLCSAQQLEYFSNHDRINELFFDEDKMWVATEGGLLELDLEGNLIKKHTVLDGMTDAEVEHVLRGEENRLFVGLGNDDVLVYQDGRWVDYDFKKNDYCSFIHNNGLFGYINHSKEKVSLYHNQTWKKYKINGEGYSFGSATVVDDDNNLWIRYKNGVIKHDGSSIKPYLFMEKEYDSPDMLLKDKNGTLWAMDISSDWYTYDKKMDAWSICEQDSCLAISRSKFAFSDSKQNLWFSNRKGSVLYKYDGMNWGRIDIPFRAVSQRFSGKKIEDRLVCGAEDKAGNLWFGTLNGNLYKYDGVSWTFMDLSQPNPYFIDGRMNLSTIHQAIDTNIWIAGWNIVKRFSANETISQSFSKTEMKEQSKAGFYYTVLAPESLIEDQSKNIYVNPQKGVFKYDQKLEKWQYFMGDMSVEFMHYRKESDRLYFLNDKGMLMTETADGEVTFRHVVQADSNGYISYRFKHIDAAGNFWIKANDTVRCITEDSILIFDASNFPIYDGTSFVYEDSKGRIWANIEEGLAYWDGQAWHSFTKKNSPVRKTYSWSRNNNNTCLPITEDRDGNILVQTSESIYQWNGKKWKTNRRWKNCLKDGGLSISLFVDSKNNMWIIDSRGGLSKCQGKNCQPITADFSAQYRQILEDTKGRIWLITKADGLFRYTN